MKKIIIGIFVVLIVIVALAFVLSSPGSSKPTAFENYFYDQMITLGVEDVGQPIEGFDSTLLIMTFPGLVPSDFENVETFEGHYEVRGAIIEFVRDQSQPISSAERTVSERGYGTLLSNLSDRLNIEPDNQARIDQIIEKIDTNIGLLRECPDQKIINRMPGTSPKSNYYIKNGVRKEIAEYDANWVMRNCTVPEQTVY